MTPQCFPLLKNHETNTKSPSKIQKKIHKLDKTCGTIFILGIDKKVMRNVFNFFATTSYNIDTKWQLYSNNIEIKIF